MYVNHCVYSESEKPAHLSHSQAAVILQICAQQCARCMRLHAALCCTVAQLLSMYTRPSSGQHWGWQCKCLLYPRWHRIPCQAAALSRVQHGLRQLGHATTNSMTTRRKVAYASIYICKQVVLGEEPGFVSWEPTPGPRTLLARQLATEMLETLLPTLHPSTAARQHTSQKMFGFIRPPTPSGIVFHAPIMYILHALMKRAQTLPTCVRFTPNKKQYVYIQYNPGYPVVKCDTWLPAVTYPETGNRDSPIVVSVHIYRYDAGYVNYYFAPPIKVVFLYNAVLFLLHSRHSLPLSRLQIICANQEAENESLLGTSECISGSALRRPSFLLARSLDV